MKKLISIFTVLAILLCFLPIKGESELIFNNSFENGTEGYTFSDNLLYEISDKYAVSGSHSIHIYNRTNYNDTVSCNIKNILTTQGTYNFSIYLRLDDDVFEYSKMYGIIQITTDTGVFIYKTSAERIVNESFVLCSAKSEITWTGNIISAVFFPQNYSTNECCNFYADNFSVKLVSEKKLALSSGSGILVGVIRNDKNVNASDYLSGLKANGLPYYYDFNTSSFDSIGTRIENDIDYALYAGINYFAYNLHDNTYSYHNSTKVKMCFIIDGSTTESQILEASSYFGTSKYQEADGRPLVIFASASVYKNTIFTLKKVCTDPYIALITSEQNNGEYADITFVGCVEKKTFSGIVRNDSAVWNNGQGVYVNTGATDNVAGRNAVLGHISDGIKVARSGKKMLLIDSWNDINSFAFIQPTYAQTTPIDGKYEIDITVVQGLHSLLSGENVSIITTRSADGTTVKTNGDDALKKDNSSSESTSSGENSGNNYSHGSESTKTGQDDSSNAIGNDSDSNKQENGKITESENTEAPITSESPDITQDSTKKNTDNKVYTQSKKDIKAFVIGVLIIAGVTEAILIYKFFTAGKKKDDKKSGDNGQGCGEQSTDENIPRDNGKE